MPDIAVPPSRLFSSAALLLPLGWLAAGPLHAQHDAAAGDAEVVEEIIVTGSRADAVVSNNTDSSLYDVFGRSFHLGLTARLFR